MNIFVAGASGTIGRRLVSQLVASGHQVTGMTRSEDKADSLRRLGAEPVVADALDRFSVIEAVREAKPEVIVHELTALRAVKNFKKFDEEFALTNRLRTEGTDHLLEAAQAVGTRRFIIQSYGNWNYARTGDGPKREEDSLDPAPPSKQRQSLEAIRYLEAAVSSIPGLEGLALRYGNVYGPGTSIGIDGDMVNMVAKRGLPVVGNGAGVWSFIHVDDAAAATAIAVERGAPGIYNIADDKPAPVSEWLPELAKAVGAKPPRHLPVWLARLFIGDVGVSMMTEIRGASNAKAKRELGWRPRYATWREGFWLGLGGEIPMKEAA